MAQFAVEIADADIPRLISAISSNYGYRATIENPNFDPEQPVDEENNPSEIPNPETPMQFANAQVRSFLSENVRSYELRIAKQAAANALELDISISDPQV